MARRRFAPTHKLLTRARYVPRDDGAWDHARIDRERDEMRKAAGWVPKKNAQGEVEGYQRPDDKPDLPDPCLHPETGHIVDRYLGGWTRFDLEAGGVSDYLDMNENPEMWLVRRLTRDDRADVRRAADSFKEAYLIGCVGVENGPPELDKALRKTGRNRDRAEIVRLTEDLADDVFDDVGLAVMSASADLSDYEKKTSGAPPGDG